MGRERSDWETPISGICVSCTKGDHECDQDAIGYACECPDCEETRVEVTTDAAEFFNGLEDFFKSIDPDRVGWDLIEADVDAGDLVN
jgi:hypothetical protein